MARSIANFLVGVGLDTKDFDKGSQNVQTDLSRFRSLAGLAGTALAGAFSAASLAAINAGNRVDKLALQMDKFNTSASFANSYGNVLKTLGGDAQDAVQAIASAEQALDKLRKGDASVFEALAFSRADVKNLASSESGEDLLRRLSGMAPDMNKQQQRYMQDALGISDAALKSLTLGRREFDSLIDKSAALSPNFEKATEAAREYNKTLAEINNKFQGFTDTLAAKLLPQFTEVIKSLDKFISNNAGKIDKAIDYAVDNSGTLATIAGGTALSAGGAVASGLGSKFGIRALSTLGAGASYGGAAGVAAGTGSLLYDLKASDIQDITGYDVSKYYRAPSETVDAIGKWWRGGTVSPSDAATMSPQVQQTRTMRDQAFSDASVPSVPQRVEVEVKLNNKMFETGVTKVINNREQATMVNSQTTVDR